MGNTMMRIRGSAATAFVILAAGTLAVAPAQAALGGLDVSFSSDGRQLTDFGAGDGGEGVAIQVDGKIVVAGWTVDGAGMTQDFALVRHTLDGTLDTSFSGDGMVTTDFGANDAGAAAAVQADGKIVVAGAARYGAGHDDFAMARYNANGSLDTTFSGDGKQTSDFAGSDAGQAVAVQSDRKIVVGGAANGDFALARYNADGSLDRTFSGDGKQTIDLGASYDAASGVAIQADGKVVAAGPSGGDFALARFSPDGSLDRTFSGDGKQSTDFGGDDESAAVALQPDGRIVAAGTSIRPDSGGYNPSGDFALARYNPDGSLDTSFSNSGKQTTEFNWDETARALAIQADGSIVVAGGQTYPAYPENGGAFALASYTPDGSLEGTQVTVFLGDVEFGAHARAEGVAIQADGKLVAVGWAAAPSFSSDFALARYEGGSALGTAPTNASPPTFSGTATDGQTLTVSPGAWTGSTPINRRDQWRRCDSAGADCVDIAAATAPTHTLTEADVGHTMRVRETATNAYGARSVDSAATAVVQARAGAIAGKVRSASTNLTISGASVNCGTGYFATTASDGIYSIANAPPGIYRCTANAKRYRPWTRIVEVASGPPTTANFSLARS